MRTRELFRGHWGSMGGPGGPRGLRGAFILMSLQMIHEAYKPIYVYDIKILVRGLTNGQTEVLHEALAT